MAVAFKGERLAARRLAARTGIAEEAALRQVMEQAAGAAGMAALLAQRLALRESLAAHASARNDRKAQALAIKLRRHDGPATPWRAWFDGSAHPNPGQCGIGGVVLGPDGQRIEISRAAGYGNSSEAEYMALIAVLESALGAGADELTVYGDSLGVIEDATGRTVNGAASLGRLREDAQALIGKMASVSLRWVPRHKNPEADALSQKAVLGLAAPDPDG